MVLPIWNRKRDLLYLIFFATHVPVMFAVDLSGFYPASIRPSFTTSIRQYYISTYRDRFFISPPLWFKGYILLELLYHLPLSLWAIPALLRNDPMVPLHLLVFAAETAMTTLTCLLEMLSWQGYTSEEQSRLCALYIPYLLLSVVMGSDMFVRLKGSLSAKIKKQ